MTTDSPQAHEEAPRDDYDLAYKIVDQMGFGFEFRNCRCGQLPCLRLKPIVDALAKREAEVRADLPRATAETDQPKEDFERPYFCAVRALRHLKNKNHEFKPLGCDGCKEVALFLTEPGYRGDEHNPIGADCERSY